MSDLEFEHEQQPVEAKPEEPAVEQEQVAEPVEEAPQEGEQVTEEAVKEPEPAPEVQPEESHVPLGALKEERAKRQSLELQNQQIMQQLQSQPQPQAPDVFEDPEAYQQHITQTVNDTVRNQIVGITEGIQKSIVGEDEYYDKIGIFVNAANSNPALVAAYNSAENPAQFAYEQGKTLSAIQEMGDPSTFGEQKLKEGIAKGMSEAEAKIKALEAEVASLKQPKSLAGEQSAAAPTGIKGSDHTPLEDILPN